MWRFAGFLLGLFLAMIPGGAAFAQAYPTKPLRIIVGAGAGSVSDVRSRWVAQHLAPILGQPVIVENRAGGSGIIAMTSVAASPPDGYTLLLVHMGTLVAPEVNPSATFDPLSDFAPLSRIFKGYGVLNVHPGVPGKTGP